MSSQKNHGIKLSLSGLIITLGIVYGDIGTSPLYTFKAITSGLTVLKPEYIYGAISLVIWTLTVLTTIKYVTFTLKADNKGEGGIFSLFALIRRRVPKAYLLALIGGSALLADGKKPWAYAHAMAKRMFGVDRVEWLSDEHMHKLVAALQIAANRQKAKGV